MTFVSRLHALGHLEGCLYCNIFGPIRRYSFQSSVFSVPIFKLLNKMILQMAVLSTCHSYATIQLSMLISSTVKLTSVNYSHWDGSTKL